MKILDLLWWIFDIGGEKTSPDYHHKADNLPGSSSQTAEPAKGIDDPDLDDAEFDEFFGN